MALKVIKYDPFPRGDTPVFGFIFQPPYAGFNWSGITIDAAMTDVDEPNDNSGAGVYRSDQVLTIDADNNANFSMQPTVAESKAFTPGADYRIEVQLKQGTENVTTPVTGIVNVLQDYVI